MSYYPTPGDAWDTLHGCLRTALDNGQLTGSAIVHDGDQWICWSWQEMGPKWIAVATAAKATEEDARSVCAQRLADEVAKHGDHPRPGMRISKAGLRCE